MKDGDYIQFSQQFLQFPIVPVKVEVEAKLKLPARIPVKLIRKLKLEKTQQVRCSQIVEINDQM